MINLRDVAQLVTDASGERPERRAALCQKQLRPRLVEPLLDRGERGPQLGLGGFARRAISASRSAARSVNARISRATTTMDRATPVVSRSVPP